MKSRMNKNICAPFWDEELQQRQKKRDYSKCLFCSGPYLHWKKYAICLALSCYRPFKEHGKSWKCSRKTYPKDYFSLCGRCHHRIFTNQILDGKIVEARWKYSWIINRQAELEKSKEEVELAN